MSKIAKTTQSKPSVTKPIKTAASSRRKVLPNKQQAISAKVPEPTPITGGEGALSKQDIVLAMLRRSDGATIDDLMKVTSWQTHSVRGFISGTVKKKLGLNVTSEKTETGRVYRIADVAEASNGE